MADVYGKKDTTSMLGVGYRKSAFPADEQGGKRRAVVDLESTIARITDLADERKYLDYEIEATIGAALTAGASWAHIGQALGMGRTGAQRKYPNARRTYGRQTDEEQARLDKAAGVAAKRIVFEVRDQASGTMTVSRHHTAENARKAAARFPFDHRVYKVYPAGRAVPLPSE